MVLLTFPNALTEEEEMLKQKFARLRKKKKQLQALKNKPETQPKPEQAAKRPVESAEEATEQAKKLVQSGAIKVSSGSKDRTGFKRSKPQEKRKEFTGYQQFREEDEKPESSKPTMMKALKESFVSAGSSKTHISEFDGDERRPRDRGSRDRESRRREPPSKGNTIHVSGEGVTEDLLKKAFASFGTIVNINTEMNKGFVTFEKMESADIAIRDMNNKLVNNTLLEVSMAFNQFNFENMQDPGAGGSMWSEMAVNTSQKGPARNDSRNLVVYDDDLF